MHINGRANMVWNYGHYFSDDQSARRARYIYRSMFFAEAEEFRVRRLNDVTVTGLRAGAEQVRRKCFGARVNDSAARNRGGDNGGDNPDRTIPQPTRALIEGIASRYRHRCPAESR